MAQQYVETVADESGQLSEEVSILTEESAVLTSRATPCKLFSLSAVLFGLVACLYVVARIGAQPAPRPTVRSLLDGPEFTNAAANNIMKLGGDAGAFTEEHRPKVHAAVARHLKDITRKMEMANPAYFAQLNEATVSHEQKSAVMKVVSSMTDPRVQDIGFDVSTAVEEGSHLGREGLKRHIKGAVTPRLQEMRALRDEILPAALRQREARDQPESFHPENMHAVRDFAEEQEDDKKTAEYAENARRLQVTLAPTPSPTPTPTLEPPTPSPTPSPPHVGTVDMTPSAYHKLENSFAVIGGLLEQLRVLLDQIDAISEDIGHDTHIPFWLKSLVGFVAWADNVFDCGMRAQANGQDNPVKVFMCPLKYSSAFFDAAHGLINVLHVDNDHLSEFFTTPPPLPAGITTPPAVAAVANAFGALTTTASPFAWMNDSR